MPTGATTSAALGGRVGAPVQRLCARVPQRAFCLSELHARRLREEGLRGQVTVLSRALRGRPARGHSHARPSGWCCSPAG